ncbi:MAG: hypothetical protein FD189_1307 [Elusimicrobia bacterium]|nr:MAG: hypothetical protein FD154_1531 [Elusimicrobiota bacterium]KAF0155714.1 MAG: hypothetical protein FD189_1307 [Elusimicrobiota bacterium]
MTSDELIQKAFAFTGKYPAAERYDFRKDGDFADFLHTRFPFVEDFLKLSGLQYDEKCNLAAIGLPDGRPVIFINPDRLTSLYKGAQNGDWSPALFYETLGCLLWHEVLHVELRHFTQPRGAAENARWNVAQDMVIDNLIHSRYPGWRNWKSMTERINGLIDKAGKGDYLQKIAVDAPAEGEVHIGGLWARDLVVYFNLLEMDVSAEDSQRVDDHRNEPDFDPLSRAKSPPKAPAEDLFDKLENLARKRNEKAEQAGPMVEPELGDIIAQKTGEARRYNLLQILKRYLRRISLKQKTHTWKKPGRKQPGRRPGVIYKKQPGEVLFIVDTSGSMKDYLQKEFSGLVKELYFAFSQLTKMQGAAFSRFFQLEADTDVRGIKGIDSPAALRELAEGSKLSGRGGTDYRAAFDWTLKRWKENAGSGQALPDLVLFLTDLDARQDFLSAAKYSPFHSRLIWLYTGRGAPFARPPRGVICNVFPDDYGANYPYYTQGDSK